MKRIGYCIAPAALAVMLAACSGDEGWKISGEVYGAEGDRMALEGFNNGSWYVVDSVDIDRNGAFAYSAPAPAAYPEVMRLSLDGRSIYFPVDSTDHITLTTQAADFGNRYSLSGTEAAVSLRQLDSLINACVADGQADALAPGSPQKRALLQRALEAPSAITGYYLVNRSVGGRPLFDLSDRADVRLYGAVAQRFATERPDDPRTKYLSERFITAQRAFRQGNVTEIAVPETKLFDIKRYDKDGKMQSLADMASKGGVTILSFTAYGAEESPAYNVTLNSLWEKYRDRGLNIYQIAFDADETVWRSTARNLPWTAVWNATTDGSEPLAKYNVGALPMTFIIDRSGTVAARVADPGRLDAEVAKYL